MGDECQRRLDWKFITASAVPFAGTCIAARQKAMARGANGTQTARDRAVETVSSASDQRGGPMTVEMFIDSNAHHATEIYDLGDLIDVGREAGIIECRAVPAPCPGPYGQAP